MTEITDQSDIKKRISKKISEYKGYTFLDATEVVDKLDEFIGMEMETITADDLALVHTTNFFPNGTILSNKDGGKIFEGIDEQNGKKYKYCHPRTTVHCTLNGLVASNSGGNWDGMPYIVIDKFSRHLNEIVNIWGGDTYSNCSLNLSNEAIYLISKDHIDSIPTEQLKNKNIIVFEGAGDIAVNEMLIMLGYKPQFINGWGWSQKTGSVSKMGETEVTLTEKFVADYIKSNPHITNISHAFDMYAAVEDNVSMRDRTLSILRNGELVDSSQNLYPTLNEVVTFYLGCSSKTKKESFDEFCSRYFIRYDFEKNQIFYLNAGACYKNAQFDKKENNVKFNYADVLNALIQNQNNIDNCHILFEAFNQCKEIIIDKVKTILQSLNLTVCLEKISNFKGYEEELLFSIRNKIPSLTLNEYKILYAQYPNYRSFLDKVYKSNDRLNFADIGFSVNLDGVLEINPDKLDNNTYNEITKYLFEKYGSKFSISKTNEFFQIRSSAENVTIINELNNINKKFILDNYDMFIRNNIISENEYLGVFEGDLANSLELLKNNNISLNLFEDILLNCKLVEKTKDYKFDLYEVLNTFIKITIDNPSFNNIQTIKLILEKYSFDISKGINIYDIINHDFEINGNEQNNNFDQIREKRIYELQINLEAINQLEQELGFSTQIVGNEDTNKFCK